MPDWGTVLAKADVAAGKTVSARCEQCHDTSSAKTNKIGPPLYGVVGRARATRAGLLLFQRHDERPRAAGPSRAVQISEVARPPCARHQDELCRPAAAPRTAST